MHSSFGLFDSFTHFVCLVPGFTKYKSAYCHADSSVEYTSVLSPEYLYNEMKWNWYWPPWLMWNLHWVTYKHVPYSRMGMVQFLTTSAKCILLFIYFRSMTEMQTPRSSRRWFINLFGIFVNAAATTANESTWNLVFLKLILIA